MVKKIHNRPIKPIVLGKIGSCYGIRGWIRMFSFTEKVENVFDYQPWFIQRDGMWKKIELESWRHHYQDIIIKLKTVDDRNSANLLSNCAILVDSSQLPKLKEGDYYWKDLIDCRVITTEGYFLGHVINITMTGSNDVLIIKAGLRDFFYIKKRLIPFLDQEIVKKVELVTKTIEVDWDPRF